MSSLLTNFRSDGKGPDRETSAAIGAGVSAGGAAIGNAMAGGRQIGDGTLSNAIDGVASIAEGFGPWGQVAAGGLKLINGFANAMWGQKWNDENMAQINSNIQNANNFQSNASSNADLMANLGNTSYGQNFTENYLGEDGWASNVIANRAKDLNFQQNQANQRQQNTIYNNATNIAQTNSNNMMANYAAYGGNLFSDGGNFSNGLEYINNGGSHEENPYQGVPMGQNIQGVSNFVEEGETVFDDYVFSDRLKVPEQFRTKYQLGKKPLTYAEASKKISKESEERPNDPISIRGLQALLGELQNSQENQKALKQAKELADQGQLANYMQQGEQAMQMVNQQAQQQMQGQQQDPSEEEIMQQQMQEQAAQQEQDPSMIQTFDKGGRLFQYGYPHSVSLHPRFWEDDYISADSDTRYTPSDLPLEVSQAKPMESTQTFIKGVDFTHKPDFQFKYLGDPYGVYSSYKLKNPSKEDLVRSVYSQSPMSRSTKPKDSTKFQDWMRFMPIFSYGTGVVEDLVNKYNKPNYAKQVESYLKNNISDPPMVSWNPIGNQLAYTPEDTNFLYNQLSAQNQAAQRSLLENAGSNRAAIAASLLANNYNNQIGMGTAYKDAMERNQGRRLNTETFNANINEKNSEGILKADMANQSALQTANQNRLTGLSSLVNTMGLDADYIKEVNNSLGNNIAGIGKLFADIGKEEASRRFIWDLVNKGVFGPMQSVSPEAQSAFLSLIRS